MSCPHLASSEIAPEFQVQPLFRRGSQAPGDADDPCCARFELVRTARPMRLALLPSRLLGPLDGGA